jgi:phosphate transport system permease protein
LANDLQGGNYSASGITAGAILGIGRAIGETAVLMVGNAVIHTFCLLEQFHHYYCAELGEAQTEVHYEALFALGCILFIILLGSTC